MVEPAPSGVEVFGALVSLARQVANAGAQELRPFGLTPAQFQLLATVRDQPQAAQYRLVKQFGVTPGNVSQLVAKLERAGLLVRGRSGSTDELAITDTAQELLDRVEPAHRQFLEDRFSVLSAGDRRLLLRLLAKVTD